MRGVGAVVANALTAVALTLVVSGPLPPQPAAPASAFSAQQGLALSATFSTIGAEVPCLAQTGTLEYRQSGHPDWALALPLWNPGTGLCRGVVLLLAAGTSYDVRATVDGLIYESSITTRAETVPPLSAVTPTHYVRVDGNDGSDGTTPATAWRTVRRALQAAPAGAVVQVGSGDGPTDEYFVDSGYAAGAPGPRTSAITLIAACPALSQGGSVQCQGRRTVIEGGIRAAPTGQAVEGVATAPWQQVALVGPTDGVQRVVWKWTGAVPTAGVVVHTLGYNQSRSAVFARLWVWASDADRLATPEGWAELMFTNLTLHYGFYQQGQDLYARLPNDASPNARWWSGSYGAGIGFNSPDSRVAGFVFRSHHIAVRGGPGSDRLVVDHNEFQTTTTALRTSVTLNPADYAEDILVERNYVRNTGLWSADQAASPSAPWDFVKRRIKLADGSFYGTVRIGGTMESAAFMPLGSYQTIVRHNTIQGTFDGIGTSSVGSTTTEHPRMNSSWDVYGNVLRQIPDDPFEPARKGDWRIWDNRTENTVTFMSTGGPSLYGPMVVFRNVGWRVGTHGVATNYDGSKTAPLEGFYFKYDGAASSLTQVRLYVVGNTFWSDRAESLGGQPAAGGGSYPQAFWLRNNVFRVGGPGLVFYANPKGQYDEDCNLFAASGPKGMEQTSPRVDFATFQAYQTATGQGPHSNLSLPDMHDVGWVDAQFSGALSGNLSLVGVSPLRAASCLVPNLSPALGPLGALP